MAFNRYLPHLIVAFVFLSLLAFYTGYDKETKTLVVGKLIDVITFKDFNNSLKELNKIFALAAIGLISITFILGPFSRIWPGIFARHLCMRKFIGLSGFGFALLHAIYSFSVIYGFSFEQIVNNSKVLGFITGLFALFIFFLMAITSNAASVKMLGYKNWKALQRTGYVALFLSILHFIILETKPEKGFDVRPYGVLFLLIAIVALILRIIVILIKLPQRQKFEDHFGCDLSTNCNSQLDRRQ